jgi:hypothetical protein
MVLAGEDKPIVVLCAGAYNEEIKKSILENINNSTIFLEDQSLNFGLMK